MFDNIIPGFDSLVLLVGLITIPAIIIFVVMTYLRVRNSRFRRQRIKPRSSGSKTEE